MSYARQLDRWIWPSLLYMFRSPVAEGMPCIIVRRTCLKMIVVRGQYHRTFPHQSGLTQEEFETYGLLISLLVGPLRESSISYQAEE